MKYLSDVRCPDPDFTEIDCLMGTTPNWTTYSAQAGHGWGALAEASGSGLATSGFISGSAVLTVTP